MENTDELSDIQDIQDTVRRSNIHTFESQMRREKIGWKQYLKG